MKLNPKGVKFCPGCPSKELTLKKAPQLIINSEPKNDTKIVTVLSRPNKKTVGLF